MNKKLAKMLIDNNFSISYNNSYIIKYHKIIILTNNNQIIYLDKLEDFI